MKDLNKKIQQKFEQMQQTGKLFRVELPGVKIWELYLASFTADNNPKFRDPNSSEKNCNHCNNFIRRYGNIVAIDGDFKITSIFDVELPEEYSGLVNVANAIKASKITEVFFETFVELNSLPYESCKKTNEKFQLGVDKNIKRYTKAEAELYDVVKENEIRTFNHMHLFVSKVFVDGTGKSVESIMANYRDSKNVFQRAMEEISLDTLNLVRDLIVQGSLLDGQTHLFKLDAIIPFKTQYDALEPSLRDNWCWVTSFGLSIAKFKNELIGVLCSELAEGLELNKACENWNKRVDPVNYMKAVAPITKKQIEDAQRFVEENDFVKSFNRRFASIDDIKASEILHVNTGDGKVKSVSIFDGVKSNKTRHKRAEFDGIEEVSIDKFMKDILPSCTGVEVLFENKHENNLVSLTTAEEASKPIFKWNNNYSWTFNGNLAGKSQIKENVKAVGGKITGILRCSLQWNDQDTPGIIDFDLHCITPFQEIYYSDKKDNVSGGWLDVDMINPRTIGIENITWQNPLKDGTYKFFVRNFSGHTKHKGFKMEIEFDGDIYTYHCSDVFTRDVAVATVNVKDGVMSITHQLPATAGEGVQKEVYGITTNEFHKVNLICVSPNHWEGNNVGNKHYMFMIDGCKTAQPIRSFHNENLIPELAAHRKVLEVLGNTTMIEPVDKQLSGLGFNATVKDEVIVKLAGSHRRMIKVKFN
jgi:hypothetical protein